MVYYYFFLHYYVWKSKSRYYFYFVGIFISYYSIHIFLNTFNVCVCVIGDFLNKNDRYQLMIIILIVL